MASLSEYKKVRQAIEELEFIVNIDIHPNQISELIDLDGDTDVYMLPAATNFEEGGSVTNTGRQIQWRHQAVTPRHNSKKDWVIMQELAEELGFGEHFDYDEVEDITREINLGTRTIGYTGQTPERIKAHMQNGDLFGVEHCEADLDSEEVNGVMDGDYYGMPWPSWHDEHPGTPVLYDASKPPAEGGMDFRARWGTEGPEGQNMLRDPYEPDWYDGGEIEGVPQYPAFHTVLPEDNPAGKTIPVEYAERDDVSVHDTAQALAEAGHDIDPSEYAEYNNPQPDSPWGRGRARMKAWNLTDEYPAHREPAVTPRPDLVENGYPCNDRVEDHWRLELDNAKVQQDNIDAVENLVDDEGRTPFVLTSGRQVEHTGAGGETRMNESLAYRSPMMYVQIHPEKAADRGLESGDWAVVETPHAEMVMQANVTERVPQDHLFAPFHWSGVLEGEVLTDELPEEWTPFVIGETVNSGTAPAYDRETQMQETKVTLASVTPASSDEIPELSDQQQSWQEAFLNRDRRS
jgi:formate dehydrogenase major subunit